MNKAITINLGAMSEADANAFADALKAYVEAIVEDRTGTGDGCSEHHARPGFIAALMGGKPLTAYERAVGRTHREGQHIDNVLTARERSQCECSECEPNAEDDDRDLLEGNRG